MEFITYPLDDRDYSAEDAELFHCTRSSGIFAEDDFAVSVTGADNTIALGPGIGWIQNGKFKGKVIAMKESTQINMGIPDAAYPRYDVLAIRFSANDNATTAVVKNGTPASSPTIPAISQTEAVYELYICAVRREVGATSITAKDVTDLRLNPAYCGLMADSAIRLDTEAINAQITQLIAELRTKLEAIENETYYAGREYVDSTFLPAETANETFLKKNEAETTYSKLVQVWQNASPESSFSAQTVVPEQSLAKAKFVYVDFLSINSGSTQVTSGPILVNGKYYATFYHSASGTIFRRPCRASAGGVYFSNGVSGEEGSNAVMIPQTIYAVF